jgi:hypothetical protein
MDTEDIKHWKLLDGYDTHSNVRGFISYERLVEMFLEEVGEARASEAISDIRITDRGISFGVVNREE